MYVRDSNQAFFGPYSKHQEGREMKKACRKEGIRKNARMQIAKIQEIKAVTCSRHYHIGSSRIQDRAGSLTARHPRGQQINDENQYMVGWLVGWVIECPIVSHFDQVACSP